MQGHNTTDFKFWYAALKQYEVKYTERCGIRRA